MRNYIPKRQAVEATAAEMRHRYGRGVARDIRSERARRGLKRITPDLLTPSELFNEMMQARSASA